MEKKKNRTTEVHGRMRQWGVVLWGVADLAGIETPRDDCGAGFPRAVSFALPVDPQIMAGVASGPTPAYAEEYTRLNRRINGISRELAAAIREGGRRALALAASERTDDVHLRGDFPHKTAATRAGLGWIGRHGQLITRPFGPWVRLGTVFTDLGLQPGKPFTRSFCGGCRACVAACPAGALLGAAWKPGVPREEILDAAACDRFKRERYAHLNRGRNCGICAAVCPYGRRLLRKGRGRAQPGPGVSPGEDL
ncbi:MAG: 4Fe-4S double cluster binding domain-containing protein [Desulfobacterales bacterium]